jgi:hypothetical protein
MKQLKQDSIFVKDVVFIILQQISVLLVRLVLRFNRKFITAKKSVRKRNGGNTMYSLDKKRTYLVVIWLKMLYQWFWKHCESIKLMRKFGKEGIAEIQSERLAICEKCDYYRKPFCSACKCFMPLKAKMPAHRCIKGKWEAVETWLKR